MIEINLLSPKAEQMALEGHYLLPIYKQAKRSSFMVLILVKMTMVSRYSLKKVIGFGVEN